MDPNTFDRIAKALVIRTTRRRVVRGLSGTVLAAFAERGRPGHVALGQTEATPSPPAAARPVFDPIYVTAALIPVDLPIGPPPNAGGTPDEAMAGPIGPEGTPAPLEPNGTPGAVESTCGVRDDSEDVELYRGDLGVTKDFVVAHQAPVGNLRWNANLPLLYDDPGNVNGVHWCSGTLIADDLFLTAGHCFSQAPSGWKVPRVNGTNDPISRAEITTNMNVSFDFQFDPNGLVRPERQIRVIGLVEDSRGGLDYAIVRLAENAGAEFGRTPVAAVDPPVGGELCIIGHPRGLQKRIVAGPASQYQGPNVYYNNIDTDGGSSGSGILSSPDGLLVGIHTNGGCDDPATGNNYGFRISALLAASPTLAGLAT